MISEPGTRTSSRKPLRRVEKEVCALIIDKRGGPVAVLRSIRDYMRLASPEPEILRIIGEESQEQGTNRLTSRQIDQIIMAARAQKL